MTLLWLGSVGKSPIAITRTDNDALFADTNELVILDRNCNVITRFTQAGDAERILDAIVSTFPALVHP